jgi:hypothetical protein
MFCIKHVEVKICMLETDSRNTLSKESTGNGAQAEATMSSKLSPVLHQQSRKQTLTKD